MWVTGSFDVAGRGLTFGLAGGDAQLISLQLVGVKSAEWERSWSVLWDGRPISKDLVLMDQ